MTHTETRSPRLPNDAGSSETVAGVQQIVKAIYAGGAPPETLELVHMRVSQINGCNACIAACQASAAECDRHAQHHEHCRLCAEECRRCESACKDLLP